MPASNRRSASVTRSDFCARRGSSSSRQSPSAWASTSRMSVLSRISMRPKNLEAYYQETGRAGRDGLPADAWMAYGIADVMNLRRLMEAGGIDEQQRRIERQKVGGVDRVLRDPAHAAVRSCSPILASGASTRRAAIATIAARPPRKAGTARSRRKRRCRRSIAPGSALARIICRCADRHTTERVRRFGHDQAQDIRRRHRMRRAGLAVGDPPARRARAFAA